MHDDSIIQPSSQPLHSSSYSMALACADLILTLSYRGNGGNCFISSSFWIVNFVIKLELDIFLVVTLFTLNSRTWCYWASDDTLTVLRTTCNTVLCIFWPWLIDRTALFERAIVHSAVDQSCNENVCANHRLCRSCFGRFFWSLGMVLRDHGILR